METSEDRCPRANLWAGEICCYPGLRRKDLQCHGQCQDYPRVLGPEGQDTLGEKDSFLTSLPSLAHLHPFTMRHWSLLIRSTLTNTVLNHASYLEESKPSFPRWPQDHQAGHHQWNNAHAPSSGLTSFWALASLGTCPPVATNLWQTFWRPRFTLGRRCLLPLTGPIFPRFSGTEKKTIQCTSSYTHPFLDLFCWGPVSIMPLRPEAISYLSCGTEKTSKSQSGFPNPYSTGCSSFLGRHRQLKFSISLFLFLN